MKKKFGSFFKEALTSLNTLFPSLQKPLKYIYRKYYQNFQDIFILNESQTKDKLRLNLMFKKDFDQHFLDIEDIITNNLFKKSLHKACDFVDEKNAYIYFQIQFSYNTSSNNKENIIKTLTHKLSIQKEISINRDLYHKDLQTFINSSLTAYGSQNEKILYLNFDCIIPRKEHFNRNIADILRKRN